MNASLPKPPFISRSKVALVAGVDDSTVKRWSRNGELPYIKLGKPKPGRVRDNRPVKFRVKDVAAFLGITPEDIWVALTTLDNATAAKAVAQ